MNAMSSEQFEQIVKAWAILSERLVKLFDVLKERFGQYIEVIKHQNQKEQCRKGWHRKTIIPVKQYSIIRKPFIRARANL